MESISPTLIYFISNSWIVAVRAPLPSDSWPLGDEVSPGDVTCNGRALYGCVLLVL